MALKGKGHDGRLSPHAASALAEMLAEGAKGVNPLAKTGEIVRFYLESLVPRLMGQPQIS